MTNKSWVKDFYMHPTLKYNLFTLSMTNTYQNSVGDVQAGTVKVDNESQSVSRAFHLEFSFQAHEIESVVAKPNKCISMTVDDNVPDLNQNIKWYKKMC